MADEATAVTLVNLRRRQAPTTASQTLEIFAPGRTLISSGAVSGEAVSGNDQWLQLLHGGFVWAGGVRVAPAPPTPSALFADRVCDRATLEWEYFEKQTEDDRGHVTKPGRQEFEQPNWAPRVGLYWSEGTGTYGLDGTDRNAPWSAAFISWIMKAAGAGSRFRYSTQHSVYIAQSIRDRRDGRADAGYWGYRLNETKPSRGDLVCWTRDGAEATYDNQLGGNYTSHADLVVEVDGQYAWVIGGNVGQSVTRRPLPLDDRGFLAETVVGGEKLFALMQCLIS